MRKSMIAAVAGLAVAALFSISGAEGYRIPLEGQFLSKGASGSVYLDGYYQAEQDQVTVEVSGLQPNSIYTVWLAKDDPGRELKGLGVKDYSFRTDASGSGRFVATVNEGELNNWDVIEVAHHPGGDPKDIEHAQIALRGDID